MNDTEKFFIELVNAGRIAIDAEGGQVFSVKHSKKRRIGSPTKAGYMLIDRRGSPRRTMYAHRLIWIVMNGEIPLGIEINHKNGMPSDNRISNLELATRSENTIHAYRILNRKSGFRSWDTTGENNNVSKLTWESVRNIRATYSSGMKNISAISRQFGVSRKTIRCVINCKTWRE